MVRAARAGLVLLAGAALAFVGCVNIHQPAPAPPGGAVTPAPSPHPTVPAIPRPHPSGPAIPTPHPVVPAIPRPPSGTVTPTPPTGVVVDGSQLPTIFSSEPKAPNAPPAPRHESIPRSPNPAAVWAPGCWVYRGGSFQWVAGRWATPPRPGAPWKVPAWKKVTKTKWIYVPFPVPVSKSTHWEFVPGRWA